MYLEEQNILKVYVNSIVISIVALTFLLEVVRVTKDAQPMDILSAIVLFATATAIVFHFLDVQVLYVKQSQGVADAVAQLAASSARCCGSYT
jgi:hypothetical protein